MVDTPTSPSPSLSPWGDTPWYELFINNFNNNLMETLINNLMETRENFKSWNETLTIEQFKVKELVSHIDVKKNPKTGKLFFTYGGKTGAVAIKGVPERPMISNVTGQDGKSFYLLHEEGQGAETLATF